jgi:hypothetical protein
MQSFQRRRVQGILDSVTQAEHIGQQLQVGPLNV